MLSLKNNYNNRNRHVINLPMKKGIHGSPLIVAWAAMKGEAGWGGGRISSSTGCHTSETASSWELWPRTSAAPSSTKRRKALARTHFPSSPRIPTHTEGQLWTGSAPSLPFHAPQDHAEGTKIPALTAQKELLPCLICWTSSGTRATGPQAGFIWGQSFQRRF